MIVRNIGSYGSTRSSIKHGLPGRWMTKRREPGSCARKVRNVTGEPRSPKADATPPAADPASTASSARSATIEATGMKAAATKTTAVETATTETTTVEATSTEAPTTAAVPSGICCGTKRHEGDSN